MSLRSRSSSYVVVTLVSGGDCRRARATRRCGEPVREPGGDHPITQSLKPGALLVLATLSPREGETEAQSEAGDNLLFADLAGGGFQSSDHVAQSKSQVTHFDLYAHAMLPRALMRHCRGRAARPRLPCSRARELLSACPCALLEFDDRGHQLNSRTIQEDHLHANNDPMRWRGCRSTG